MIVDVNFNPLLPFKEIKTVPAHLEPQIISIYEPLYYSSPTCEVLIQRLKMFEKPFWYTIINSTKDSQLMRLEFSPGVHKILVYAIRNEDEMMYLHQDVGVDIQEGDYCYLGGGFKARDLRVLLGKGAYCTLTYAYTLEEDKIDRMEHAETMLFINKFLFALGILNPKT